MSSETVPRLKIASLSRRLAGREILSSVSLEVMAGQVACLLGPSGCGKTTLLRNVAGVDRPDEGSIAIDGKAVAGGIVMSVPPERRSVGLMFQDFALFPHLTVSENVAFGLRGGRIDRAARIAELLEKVGLSDHRDRYPHEISGGEQQRVALARALAPRPRILLLDEPFASIDDRLRDGVRNEALRLLREERAAVLLVTHEPMEAMRVADRIYLMRQGRIVQEGPPTELYNAPVDREAAEFFSEVNMFHGVVRDGEVETPFGRFAAPDMVDGADVEIVIRPQHVRVDFDRNGAGPRPTERDGVPARGIVKRAVYIGNSSIVEFSVESTDETVTIQVPSMFLPRQGAPLWLSLRRDRCHLFPCTVQSRVATPYRDAAEREPSPGAPAS